MPGSSTLRISLLPGARELLALHAAELPQRDDLCGCFCGALALRAAGLSEHGGAPLDQDALALAARSVISRVPDTEHLPRGETGRRDYRLALAATDDAQRSGTTAEGLVSALRELSSGTLAAIPLAGPWGTRTLAGLFDAAAGQERPAALIANLATRHLWSSHASLGELLSYLLDGRASGPAPDWDVGHFVCVVARVEGPGGSLYAIADTYRSLGRNGVHLQPAERLAAALARREGPAGGVIALVSADAAEDLRGQALALGLEEGVWDNGTTALEMPA
jgi:hypothetical protein